MKKILFLSILSIFSLFMSLKIAYSVAETFFFDRLFYQKTAYYGYWVPSHFLKSKDFGKRTTDLVELRKYIDQNQVALATTDIQHPQVLGKTSQDEYSIFVVGDSYVFGQGIKTEERFSNILSKELNNVRKTRVYIFGNSGDNIFDNYLKYKAAVMKYGQPNLVLFSLVDNDLLFNKYQYDQQFMDKMTGHCTGESIVDPYYSNPNVSGPDEYFAQFHSLLTNTANYCAYEQLVPLLPKEHTLYLDFDGFRHPDWDLVPKFVGMIQQNGFDVFSFSSYYQSHQLHYWPTNWLPKLFHMDPFAVSKMDLHPSALANRIYADALFDEITHNQKWQFHQDRVQ